MSSLSAKPSREKEKEVREMYDLKQKVLMYYKENGVPQKMEDILNTMYADDPDDPYGHVANYFESFSKTPTITKLLAREAFDSKGQPTVQTEVYCVVKNFEQLLATATLSSQNWLPDSARQEDKDTEDAERQEFVTAAVEHVNGSLSAALKGVDPKNQKEVDQIIYEIIERMRLKEVEERVAKEQELAAQQEEEQAAALAAEEANSKGKAKSPPKSPKGKGKAPAVAVIPDEPKEEMYKGSNCLGAVSITVCQAAAQLKKVELYEHIASLRFEKMPSKFCVPLPMVTILQSGKAFPGKLNCVKEFMLVPKPGMPVQEAMRHMTTISNNIAKGLMAKAGIIQKNVNDLGSLCPQIDRPEQGLDMLQDAITGLELTPGEDFHIVLNCGAHEWFDAEKGKYEVIGGLQKSYEDMVEFWAELLGRYPSVIGLIDPIRQQEKKQWMEICDRLSERCFIIGENVYSRPGLLKHDELTEEFVSSGVVFRLEQMNQVTDILDCAKKMEEAGNQIILSSCQGETSDTQIVDMAVGLNARFIKVGGPSRGERIAKINRLLQLEDNLSKQGKLSPLEPHAFPKISPPPVPEEEEPGSETASQRSGSGRKK
ncbi:enolase 4 [Lingula anatina]|uniref:Enolase 4 n=1 Tax=Lingula anatina TaxID=7574 RepID=A0A1S3KE19_LINAN|nr:enolase 4 [Lingula anatina]|eukprot:XP_013420699.1 enolase 4 [Lingula anatina]